MRPSSGSRGNAFRARRCRCSASRGASSRSSCCWPTARLPRRDRGRLPGRVRQRRRGRLAGPDEHAGGRRARRQARAAAGRRRRGARDAAADALGSPEFIERCRSRMGAPGRCTGSAASTRLRRDAPSSAAAGQGRFIDDQDVESGGASSSSAARSTASCSAPGRRSARPCASPTAAVRGHRRDGGQGADVLVLRPTPSACSSATTMGQLGDAQSSTRWSSRASIR